VTCLLIGLLVGLAATYLLWIFYLAVMNLKRAKESGLLNKTSTVLGTPVLIIGYLLDAFVNAFVMTFLFWEIPKELTVTSRLKRHILFGQGRRLRLASWFIPILDPFDPSGFHISAPK
jgi:hypothetical protein